MRSQLILCILMLSGDGLATEEGHVREDEKNTNSPSFITRSYKSLTKNCQTANALFGNFSLAEIIKLFSKLMDDPGIRPYLTSEQRLLSLQADVEEILGPKSYKGGNDVAQGNFGIRDYLSKKFQDSPEFSTSAIHFYADVARLDIMGPEKRSGSVKLFQTLDAKAPSPGWVWDLALKHSNNDPLKAMQLIGLCGHDDLGDTKTRQTTNLTDNIIGDYQIMTIQRLEYQIKNEIQFGGSYDGKYDRNLSLAKLPLNDQNREKILSNESLHFWCPAMNSYFYYPQALSKDVDISSDLKTRIQQNVDAAEGRSIQSGYSSAVLDVLTPAKNYHFYGGALLACELIKRGHNPSIIKLISKSFSWLYRMETLKGVTCHDDYYSDAIELLKEWSRKFKIKHESYSINYEVTSIPKGDSVMTFVLSDEIKNKKTAPAKPKKWSQQKYDNAVILFNRILTDVEWTITQHQIGAEFAISQCPDKN